MKKVYLSMLILVCLFTTLGTSAQTWFLVAPEGSGTSVTLPAGTIYEWGTSACPVTGAMLSAWVVQTVVNTTAITPLTNASADSNPFPFPDPCPGTVKQLMVQETASVQTITVTGAPVIVPALVSSTGCVLPTAGSDPNAAMLTVPINCPLMPNAVVMGVDGNTAIILNVAAPVYIQYCVGTVCNVPVMWGNDPIPIGPAARLGGPPVAGGTAPGTLYLIEGQRAVTWGLLNPLVTTPAAPSN